MTRLVFALLLAVAVPLAAAQPAAPVESGGPPASFAETDDPTPYSGVALLSAATSAAPGDAFDVALEITLDDGWHTYWTNPGDTGQAVSVQWSVPEGVRIGPLGFPPPTRYELEGIVSYAHFDTVRFPARVSFAEDVPASVEIVGAVRYLVCAEVCLPVDAEVRATITRGDLTSSVEAPVVEASRAAVPSSAVSWTPTARDMGEAPDGRRRVEVRIPSAAGDLNAPELFPLAPLAARPYDETGREDGVWKLSVLTPTADRFRGVLAWTDAAGSSRAVELDVLVEGAPVSGGGGASGASFGWAMLWAFLGGLLLNLMPCVFPILSIKVLGFVGGDRQAASLRRSGWAFGAGVLASFWILAGALLAFRAAGAGLGWGFQLQSPPLVAGLAALMVALALNLLGVFEVGTRLAGAGGRLDRGSGVRGAFGSGVLAVVVATPCTAPFMGAALAYALGQPPVVSMAVFTALGVGMALPYVLLSLFPAWTDRLPRPGAWMVTLRGALAFPLLATAVWLVWVFARQTGPDGAALLLLGLVALGLAVWVWGRGRSVLARGLAVGALVAAVALGTVATQRQAPAEAAVVEDWAPYDADALAALRAEGRPVFVDVTAAWCLTCQVNERTALASDAVTEAFLAADVALVKADWTSRDADITAFLDGFGRAGVPLYVYFPPGGEAVVLPEVLTPGIVLDVLGTTVAEVR